MNYHLNHVHMGDTNVHVLEISARCGVCEAAMTFLGDLPMGGSLQRPTLDLDRGTISLPMVGTGEAPDAVTEALLRRGA